MYIRTVVHTHIDENASKVHHTTVQCTHAW